MFTSNMLLKIMRFLQLFRNFNNDISIV